jgi:plasmid stabilization system protein ParE
VAPRFRVLWTEQASADLTDIIRHIALDSLQNASRVYKGIRTRANALKTFPERGHVMPELAELGVTDYRELSIPPYRVVYRINGKTVFVQAVLDGRRDLKQILSERLLR